MKDIDVMRIINKYGFTPTEARVFDIIKRSPGGEISKEALHTRLYAHSVDETPSIKIIDILVCKVRKKLDESPYRIETIWGVGYRLVEITLETDNRNVIWYAQYVHQEYSLRRIAKPYGVHPSVVLRAVNRTVERYDRDTLEKAAKEYLSTVDT